MASFSPAQHAMSRVSFHGHLLIWLLRYFGAIFIRDATIPSPPLFYSPTLPLAAHRASARFIAAWTRRRGATGLAAPSMICRECAIAFSRRPCTTLLCRGHHHARPASKWSFRQRPGAMRVARDDSKTRARAVTMPISARGRARATSYAERDAYYAHAFRDKFSRFIPTGSNDRRHMMRCVHWSELFPLGAGIRR